jgi:peptide/nickel transport system permease protein
MIQYLARQLATIIPTILATTLIAFLLIHSAPGDPASVFGGDMILTAQQQQALRARYGLDQPLPVQFAYFLAALAQGDLGRSFASQRPVAALIAERLPATLLLTLSAAAAAFAGGVLLATLARQPAVDASVSTLTVAFAAMPPFWLGLLLMLLFAVGLRWFPTSGYQNARVAYTGMRHALDVLWHLFLPWLTLTLVQLPAVYRVARAGLAQVGREPFITTMRAAGLPPAVVFRRYALRNALLPVVALFGVRLGYLVVGAAVVEVVFAWPGIGRLMLDAVAQRDYPVLMGVYLIVAVCVTIATLIADLVCGLLDPRVRVIGGFYRKYQSS